MSSGDREAQEDELLALASIYHRDEFRKTKSVQGRDTRIYLDLPQNFKMFVGQRASGSGYLPTMTTFSCSPPWT
uniref:Uncharacterized protein n=1 Tax=Oryctolagus cuniculus TaxID=9986 RepID=A0A5F9CXQ5_RABIT